ncbi:OPT/YSL family transporter [Pendulispora brunnea]|uniref:OPT/YSL family transporter n=1 Tax=Pendulispora brunnea TaxID=2905690 RepID=A0ABZ2K015_9BACT
MTMRPREFAAAAIVAAVVGVVFPYATLRLGFGPNVSIVSTLLGFVVLRATGSSGRTSLHVACTAGVAAGQTAFMGVALAAFEILRARDPGRFTLHPSAPVVFAWIGSAGALGVLAALPLRRHFIEHEKLTFAGGACAAETMLALDRRDGAQHGRRDIAALAVSFVCASGFTFLRPAALAVSPLGIGSGMLIGLRVAFSMALGGAIAHAFPAHLLPWMGAALVVAGGLTSALARVPSMLSGIASGHAGASGERLARYRMAIAAAGAALLVLCAIDGFALHLSIPMTLASVALAAPLLLVGTRVLGETNWAPVLSLATLAQAVLASIDPGNLAGTMVGGALCGAIPNGGQHMMQSFRAASIVGASARTTAVAQLVGVVIGALALSVTYPLLAAAHAGGVVSPLSEAWATSAEALARGPSSMPHAMVMAMAAAGAVGVVLALLERRFGRVMPSAPALGIGMLVPWGLASGVLAGSAAAWIAARIAPRSTSTRGAAVASGLVAGEALAACGMAAVTALLGH